MYNALYVIFLYQIVIYAWTPQIAWPALTILDSTLILFARIALAQVLY